MSKELLDFDPVTGMATWHHYDEATDSTTIQTVQDVEPILEANKRLQNAGGYKDDFWHHIATIPNAIIEKWLKEKGIDVFNKDHQQAVMRLLDDPDWRYLRTDNSKLGRITRQI